MTYMGTAPRHRAKVRRNVRALMADQRSQQIRMCPHSVQTTNQTKVPIGVGRLGEAHWSTRSTMMLAGPSDSMVGIRLVIAQGLGTAWSKLSCRRGVLRTECPGRAQAGNVTKYE